MIHHMAYALHICCVSYYRTANVQFRQVCNAATIDIFYTLDWPIICR